MAEKVTAEDIRAAMKQRFTPPEHALFFEVGNGTGSNLRGWADAWTMNLFPSKGLAVTGYEIKVSRSDLKKELEQPKKSDNVGKYCDYWYLVVPKGLIREEDMIPPAWGILEYSEGKLRQTKRPEKIESIPLTRAFIAAILRREQERSGQALTSEVYRLSDERVRNLERLHEEELVRVRQREHESANRRLEHLKESIAAFQEASGIEIGAYDGEKLGEAVKIAEALGLTGGRYGSVKSMISETETFLNKLKNTLAEVEGNAECQN